ncbi:hypothetical protein [Legionella bononiensis]|uniref:Uncharacterized protein n=1 Tax=Legionella bononiensis TaxID=2793102 RepID=A0ABS1WAY6_9GAMM|nr:hypothetical protein [Legionella bononiensis]MBL7480243.1 hypothetical protein [Legionella bononiensis]MBL7526525.1 hypothetical protein [Legionella bononiensis]MBL7562981.1 hypothetical protein [Legionella bononiensis]
MSQVEQSYTDFKKNMYDTFNLSITPLNLLITLFRGTAAEEHSELVRGFSLFFALISSPVLLLAIPVTLALGVIAGVVQTVFLPFQFLFSLFQDLRSAHVMNAKQEVMKHDLMDSSEELADDLVPDPSAGTHFPPLFSNDEQKPTLVIDVPSIETSLSPQ